MTLDARNRNDLTHVAHPAPPRRPRSDGLWMDPRTKLVLLITLSTTLLAGWPSSGAAWVRPVLIMVPLVLLISIRRFVMAAGFAAALLGCYLAAVLLVPIDGPVAVIGSFGALALRVLPVATLGAYITLSTRVSELVAALQRWHVPSTVSIPLTVMLRFLPTVAQQNKAISEAMTMRGVSSWRAGPLHLLEYRMVPLLVSVTTIADELVASALTRGLGGPWPRTNVCRIGFAWPDALLAAFGVIVLAVTVTT
jgi:energy-coupling factor transporter transmembrane protein EcfT